MRSLVCAQCHVEYYFKGKVEKYLTFPWDDGFSADAMEEYYERVGLVIPNVVFPTGSVVKDGLLYIYYGCADTAIGLATVPVQDLVSHVLEQGNS
jgi:hypothetical protein